MYTGNEMDRGYCSVSGGACSEISGRFSTSLMVPSAPPVPSLINGRRGSICLLQHLQHLQQLQQRQHRQPIKYPAHFVTLIKQNGALMAKGRLSGVQFDALFTNNLYTEISKNAIQTAQILKDAFKKKGYRFFINSPTNQIFIILENEQMKQIQEKVAINFWEKYDNNHTVVRFATSWATRYEDVEKLIELL